MFMSFALVGFAELFRAEESGLALDLVEFGVDEVSKFVGRAVSKAKPKWMSPLW